MLILRFVRVMVVVWVLMVVVCVGALIVGRSLAPAPKVAYMHRPDNTGVAFMRVQDIRTMVYYDFPVVHGNLRTPRWSPDGRYLYFTDRTNAEFALDIYAHDTYTGRSERLLTEPMNQHPMTLSQDGRYLVYLSELPSMGVSSYVYDLQTGTHSPQLFAIDDPNDMQYIAFDWSHSSRYLLFTERRELYRYDTQTGYIDALLKGEQVEQPQWLPDDTSISYVQGDTRYIYNLRTHDITAIISNYDTSTPTSLISYLYYSPDEQWMVYSEMLYPLQSELHLLNMTTGETRAIGTDPYVYSPYRWLDARTFVYNTIDYGNSIRTIYEADIHTGETRRIRQFNQIHLALWYPRR